MIRMVINKYFTIESKKIKKEQQIAVLSDLHFTKHLPKNLMKNVVVNIKKHHPNIIVIAGDIIDSTNKMENPSIVNSLQNFLVELTRIAPVVVCYGNHDLRKMKKHKEFSSSPSILKEATSSIQNFHLLNETEVELHGITFFDFTLPFSYYTNKKHREDLVLFNEYSKTRKRPNDSNFHILLCHTPNFFYQLDLNNIDFIISGHMHHGLVSNVLDKLWKSNRGLIGPYKQLFPRYARGMVYYPTPHLISGGINKIVYPKNTLFAPHIEYITLKNKS